MTTRVQQLFAACIVIAAVLLGLNWLSSNGIEDGQVGVGDSSSVSTPANSTESTDMLDMEGSPFATQTSSGVGVAGRTAQNTLPSTISSGDFDNTQVSNLPAVLSPIDVFALGQSDLSDAQFLELVARLQSDPDLLQAVLNEFRTETDRARLKRLSQLLGDINDPSLSLAASELIFSGDPVSRTIGLDLLKRIQPGNPEAASIVSGLLATEVEPQVLVETLTAIARQGSADTVTRKNLSEQVALLTKHNDVSVRRTSLDILSRWTEDPRHTPLLLDGLSDTEMVVRQTAAYALVEHEDQSEEVMQRLFEVVVNTTEEERVRRAAILALKAMPISEQQRQTVQDTEKVLDRRQR